MMPHVFYALDPEAAAEEKVRRDEAMHIIGVRRLEFDERPTPIVAWTVGTGIVGFVIGVVVGGVL